MDAKTLQLTSFGDLRRCRRRRGNRRGSILVIVVALLTLVALIGTALIATARTDRYTTRAYSDAVVIQTSRQQYVDQVVSMVESTLLSDKTPMVDSPRVDTWLAERLPDLATVANIPSAANIPGTSIAGGAVPVWRSITGRLVSDPNVLATAYPTAVDFQPPFQTSPGSLISPANTASDINSLIKQKPTDATAAVAAATIYLARPWYLSVTYPNTHPVESMRNKTRTYPALVYYDNTGAHNPADGMIYLAADADGDGIADSALFRLSASPDNGVMYYAGVRIVDNNSAVNVNTALSNSFDFDNAGAKITAAPTFFPGFFTSSVGLYELLSKNNDVFSGKIDADEELAELDEYRFGYPSNFNYDGSNVPSSKNWADTFKDHIGNTFAFGASLTPVEEPDPNTATGNSDKATARADFLFQSQGEALSTQLSRRLDNPGRNSDLAYKPTDDANSFPYRGYNLSNPSTVALAYRFMMVNPEVAASDLELRLRKSAYESAPNYTDFPRNTADGSPALPGFGFLGRSNVYHWTSFPANQVNLWFQYLNYPLNTGTPAYDAANTNFAPTTDSTISPAMLGVTQFRSVRPLLTAYSATSNLIPESYRWTNEFYTWNRNSLDKYVIYPGMFQTDMSKWSAPLWSPGGTYHVNVFVTDGLNNLVYMRAVESATNPQPSTDASGVWVPQPLSTGLAKANVNVAGFPELWKAYFSVMFQGNSIVQAPTEDGGTPFDKQYFNEVKAITGAAPATMSQAFYQPQSGGNVDCYDIYRGMHWKEDYTVSREDPTFYPRDKAHPAEEPTGTGADNVEENALRMFRSSIRDPRGKTVAGLHRLTPYQMMVLRSAIAAVNTEQMRSPRRELEIISRKITLYDTHPELPNPPSGSPTRATPVPQYEVTVFGQSIQPFITEVYATNDKHSYSHGADGTRVNPKGYVAIELYNPYDVEIDLTGFQILNVQRTTAAFAANGMDVTAAANYVAKIPDDTKIGPGGFLVLEGYDQTNASTAYQALPVMATLVKNPPPYTSPISIPELTKLIGSDGQTPGELVLMRPKVLLTHTTSADIPNMVPVDQFDFTNFPSVASNGDSQVTAWHYVRRTDNWFFVYPGRYDASVPTTDPRQQGTHRVSSSATDFVYLPSDVPASTSLDPWIPADDAFVMSLDKVFGGILADASPQWNARLTETPGFTFGAHNTRSTYTSALYPNLLSIPLRTTDTPGRHPAQNASNNIFPFGGFARNGDILNVPFIGAYVIRTLEPDSTFPAGTMDPGKRVDTTGNSILEMNSVTMDAAFAEDSIAANNIGEPTQPISAVQQENVGRFIPLPPAVQNPSNSLPPLYYVNYSNAITPSKTIYEYSGYDWAKNLFNYVTTQTPSADYLPNISPYVYNAGVVDIHNQPQPVPSKSGNTVTKANDFGFDGVDRINEDSVPTQGLININTAPARVLATLPLVPDTGTGATDPIATEKLAVDIVNARNTGANGRDFFSVFDLATNVDTFMLGGMDRKTFSGSGTNILGFDPTDRAGDYSGLDLNANSKPDEVRYDFEEQNLILNRISNLITTRSDTYTVYIVVQGWREANTPFPVLDWEQRVAYIMDRSTGKIIKASVPTN